MAERTAEIAKLRGTKSVFLRHAKNTERELIALLNKINIQDDEEICELNALNSSFSDKVERIKDIDSQILDLLKHEEREKELDANLNWEENNYKIFAKIERCLTKIKNSESTQNSQSSQIPNEARLNEIRIKLPKLELPKFNGDIKCWQGFWDQFDTSIHQNNLLSDIEKFNYLRTFLTDSAYEIISGLALNSENYKEAIKVLKERYGNKQTLIFSYMDSFVQLPTVKNSNDVINLRKLYDKIEIGVRNLDSLKVKKESYGTLLISLINNKIPDDLRLHLSRKFQTNLWDIEKLLFYLRTDIEAKERLLDNHYVSENKSFSNSQRDRIYKEKTFSSQALFSNQESRPRNEIKKHCIFCNLKNHAPSRCLKVTNVSSRKNILRKNGMCFICFDKEHLASQCLSSYRCNKCNGKHHISICMFDKNNDKQYKKEDESTATNFATSKNNVLLQTAFVEVKNIDHSKKKNVHVLFDTGSQRSYVSSSLRKELNLKKLRTESIKIKTFGNNTYQTETVDIVSIMLVANEKLITIEAICYPTICSELINQDVICAVNNYKHLQQLPLADSVRHNKKDIQILIGLDYYYSCVTGTQIKGLPNEPLAISSIFGWIICGSNEVTTSAYSNVCHLLHAQTEIKHSYSKNNIYGNENTICNDYLESDRIDNEELNYNDFIKNIQFHDKRYCVKLPFKNNNRETLPDNFQLARNRLRCLKNRLSKKPAIFDQYDKIIKDYLKEGIVEVVNELDENVEIGSVHYLPHQYVIKEDRQTTKLRVVFDAASKYNNETSLNEHLLPGPCLLPLLYDILVRFRIGKYGLVADIKQAFLQICLNEAHRNFTRFLWFKDIYKKPLQVICLRFNRVLFGLTSSPFLLNATLKYHLQSYLCNPDMEKIVDKLVTNLYVDDSTNTFNNITEAIEFYDKSKTVMLEGGFDLRKWESNNKEIQTYINTKDGNMLNSNDTRRKVLGLVWDIDTDEIVYDFADILDLCKQLTPTKRNMLRIQGSFYDPLGLISPITLQMKLILQTLFALKLDWDTCINIDEKKRWEQFIKELQFLKHVSVNRQVLCCNSNRIQLHGFCDSSGKAYSAVVYARVECVHGLKVLLWSSKCRIASIKSHTIPRLELMSCVLLGRLVSSIKKAIHKEVSLKNEDIYCWSDSMVALWWIKQVEKTWKNWVQNRVVEVRKLVDPERWFYVPTEFNPADIATRVMSLKKLVEKDTWWKGPEFLIHNEKFWPGRKIELENENLMVDLEERAVVALSALSDEGSLGDVICCERYGKLSKLLNVTSYVFRFINNLKAKLYMGDFVVGELSSEEIHHSKIKWVKYEQNKIKQERDITKLIASLNIYEDENGVLRLKSRLQHNEVINYSSKNPILLRNGSLFTKLIVENYHERAFHNGTETTLNMLRNEYWIIKGRQQVKQILKHCFVCKHVNSKPATGPKSPELPSFRVNFNRGFEVIGVDYAGPLFCRSIFSSSETSYKCYILLFTCGFSRAVHLEITSDLTAENFLLAFKRFISRRGKPVKVISDNAKTFKSVKLNTFLNNNNIMWDFILERAPWWGGFYERLIGLVKRSLKKVLKRALLNYEELMTIVTEIEFVTNSRPLTYISEEEFYENLTPNHLLYGHALVTDETVSFTEIHDNKKCRDVREHCLSAINHYKKRFYDEYLNALKERHCYQNKNKNPSNVTIGDVVLIKESVRPRQMWKKGRIVSFIKGNDNRIRGVKLLTVNRKFEKVELRRPLQLIIPLEILSDGMDQVDNRLDGADRN